MLLKVCYNVLVQVALKNLGYPVMVKVKHGQTLTSMRWISRYTDVAMKPWHKSVHCAPFV